MNDMGDDWFLVEDFRWPVDYLLGCDFLRQVLQQYRELWGVDGGFLQFVYAFVDEFLDYDAGEEKHEGSDRIKNCGSLDCLFRRDLQVDNDKTHKVVAMLNTALSDHLVKRTTWH